MSGLPTIACSSAICFSRISMSPDLRLSSARTAALRCAESGPLAFSNLAACPACRSMRASVSGRVAQPAAASSENAAAAVRQKALLGHSGRVRAVKREAGCRADYGNLRCHVRCVAEHSGSCSAIGLRRSGNVELDASASTTSGIELERFVAVASCAMRNHAGRYSSGARRSRNDLWPADSTCRGRRTKSVSAAPPELAEEEKARAVSRIAR